MEQNDDTEEKETNKRKKPCGCKNNHCKKCFPPSEAPSNSAVTVNSQASKLSKIKDEELPEKQTSVVITVQRHETGPAGEFIEECIEDLFKGLPEPSTAKHVKVCKGHCAKDIPIEESVNRSGVRDSRKSGLSSEIPTQTVSLSEVKPGSEKPNTEDEATQIEKITSAYDEAAPTEEMATADDKATENMVKDMPAAEGEVEPKMLTGSLVSYYSGFSLTSSEYKICKATCVESKQTHVPKTFTCCCKDCICYVCDDKNIEPKVKQKVAPTIKKRCKLVTVATECTNVVCQAPCRPTQTGEKPPSDDKAAPIEEITHADDQAAVTEEKTSADDNKAAPINEIITVEETTPVKEKTTASDEAAEITAARDETAPTEETTAAADEATPTEEITAAGDEAAPTKRMLIEDNETTPIEEKTTADDDEVAPTAEIAPAVDKVAPTEEIVPAVDEVAPTEEISTADDTVAPAEEKTITEEVVPTEEITSAVDEAAPTEEIATPVDKVAPTEEISTADGTVAPPEEIATPVDEVAPTEEISTADGTVAPPEEISTADGTVAPNEKISTADDSVAQTEDITTAEEVVPTEEVTSAADQAAPTEEITTPVDTVAPTDEISTADGTVAPTEEISTADGTVAPTEEISTADGTVAPVEEISTADGTVAPVEELSTADGTVAPPEEISTADGTVAPPEEISTADGTVAPTEEISTADGTVAPVEEISTADGTVAPVEEISTADGTVAPVEEISTADGTVAPTEEISTADGTVAPPEEKSTADDAVAPTEETTTTEKVLPTEEVTSADEEVAPTKEIAPAVPKTLTESTDSFVSGFSLTSSEYNICKNTCVGSKQFTPKTFTCTCEDCICYVCDDEKIEPKVKQREAPIRKKQCKVETRDTKECTNMVCQAPCRPTLAAEKNISDDTAAPIEQITQADNQASLTEEKISADNEATQINEKIVRDIVDAAGELIGPIKSHDLDDSLTSSGHKIDKATLGETEQILINIPKTFTCACKDCICLVCDDEKIEPKAMQKQAPLSTRKKSCKFETTAECTNRACTGSCGPNKKS